MAVLTESEFIRESINENLFWLRIMKEHALFMSEGFDRNDKDLIREADQFFDMFDRRLTETRSLRLDADVVRRFNEGSISLTRRFRDFKSKVLLLIITCKIRGFNFPLLIDHTAREAGYFVLTLENLNAGKSEPLADKIVDENVFWLRIMADHSKFIASLLDPSERKLVTVASTFSDEFDQLLAQARDLESMVKQTEPSFFQTLTRFTGDVQSATTDLRNFKKDARDLIRQCKVLSLINPILADHVTREANKFLSILNDLSKRADRASVLIEE
ncbi:hypothetical protein DNHGIG_19610 [Collibacillus ludicampi]|uniref:DUF2935 domain-containing protein n=1 Tax=Collibacillus ludicampi TaxID=2771369 RepID=A0AAV4LF12_9BACL|nr:DUF2935 domain-containing protein [Collibacillus ludicampi]GIM46412.1 hypothetical protein DNHGIG_19610 [Collibacillus ludicampi]